MKGVDLPLECTMQRWYQRPYCSTNLPNVNRVSPGAERIQITRLSSHTSNLYWKFSENSENRQNPGVSDPALLGLGSAEWAPSAGAAGWEMGWGRRIQKLRV